jgi:PAS domain S-box-containing protein
MGQMEVAVAQRTARAVTDAVGDGCVVRLVDDRLHALRTVAVDHRDPERREQLEALLEDPLLDLPGGWAGEALVKDLCFRVRHEAAAEAAGGDSANGGSEGAAVHGAVVAPLRSGGDAIGVLVALRDSADCPYTLHEQQLVEGLADEDHAGAPLAASAEPFDPSEDPVALRMLEQAPAGIWATDLAGRTTYVNAALCELVGLPSASLVDTPITEYLDEEPQLVHARLARQTEHRDHRLLRPDGQEVWVSVSSTALTDGHGRRRGTVSTLTEIGERKRLEVEARLRAAAHEAVAELAERALAAEQPGELARRAAALTADILAVDYVGVCEIAPDQTAVIPRAVVGWDERLVGERVPLPDHCLGRLSLDDGEPVVVKDYREAGELKPGGLVDDCALRSAVCVRIGDGLGLISAHSHRVGAFAGRDLSFLRPLAALLAGRWRARERETEAVAS